MRKLFLLLLGLIILVHPHGYAKPSSKILPLIGYSESTSLLTGFKYIKPSFINQVLDLDVLFIYTLKNNFIVKTRIERQKQLPYWLSISYVNYPNNFYGIGNSTKTDKYDVFTEKYSEINPGIQIDLSKDIYYKIDLSLKDISLKTDNPQYALASNQIGKNGGIINLSSITFLYDRRNKKENASSGSLNSIKYSISDKTLASDYNFTKIESDNRYYFSFNRNNVLAIQLLLKAAKGDVPFYELPSLGGEETLRGFLYGRLRDKVSIHLGSEYRFPLHEINKIKIAGIVFIDIGRVYSSLDKIELNDLYMAYGGGLRFILSPSAIVRLDMGFSYEGLGLNLTFGNTF